MEFVCNGPNVILLTIQGGSEGAGAGNPIGTVATFAGSTPPANWLICDGSTVSRTEWLDLFNVIGVTYGAGNGSTTFNLPDARGRAIIGAGQGTGLSNRSLGTTGGTETQAITIDQLAAHTHTANHSHTGTTDSAGAHTHTVPLGGPAGASGGDRVYPQTGSQNTGSSGAHTHTLSIASANVTSSSVGAGQPHNNMQPFITMNYIIFGGSNSA
ncbi:MAG: phage tail protein [Richelia sp. RM2_1_2]|nr:phage tail protein [Richelia sp. RM2_1_2]